jgi:hypothetical protein
MVFVKASDPVITEITTINGAVKSTNAGAIKY